MAESDYLAALESGFTTRARCWPVTRTDGVVLGFTDDDRDVTFDGTTFEAAAALAPSEASALTSKRPQGRFPRPPLPSRTCGAAAMTAPRWRCSTLTGPRLTTAPRSASTGMGEVSRGDGGFPAELVSRSAELQKRAGRRFLPVCDAVVGDARCGLT